MAPLLRTKNNNQQGDKEMNARVIGVILAATAALPASAVEPGKAYAGVMLQKVTYEESAAIGGDSVTLESEPEAFAIRIGLQLSEYVSVEARYGLGTSDDNLEVSGEDSGYDFGVDNYYGAYVRAHMPNKTIATPYFVAGYSEIKAEIADESTDGTSDLAMGVGADFAIGSAIATIEYLSMLDKAGGAGDALSIGISFAF
jgi:hypothetical protein